MGNLNRHLTIKLTVKGGIDRALPPLPQLLTKFITLANINRHALGGKQTVKHRAFQSIPIHGGHDLEHTKTNNKEGFYEPQDAS